MKKSSSEMLMGLILILLFVSHLNDVNSGWDYIAFLFYAGSIGFAEFLLGVFDWREYYNRTTCWAFINVFLLGVVILTILKAKESFYFYIFIIGIFIVTSLLIAYTSSKRMEKYQRITEYNKTLKMDPEDINTLNSKGVVFEEIKDYKKAVEVYDKALKLNPEYAAAWYNMGNALSKMRKYSDAIRSYDKALAIDPDHVKAWNNKGNSLRMLGRNVEALYSYDKAWDLSPRNVKTLYNKGVVLEDEGKYQDAVESYDKLLELNPENVKAWYNRGTSLRKLGKLQEAMESYDTALGLDPDFEPVKKAKKKLNKLVEQDSFVNI